MLRMIFLFLCMVIPPAFSNNDTFPLTELKLSDLESSIVKDEKNESLMKIKVLNASLSQDHDSHKRSSDHKIMVDHSLSELKKISEFIKSDKKNAALIRLKAMKSWLKAKS